MPTYKASHVEEILKAIRGNIKHKQQTTPAQPSENTDPNPKATTRRGLFSLHSPLKKQKTEVSQTKLQRLMVHQNVFDDLKQTLQSVEQCKALMDEVQNGQIYQTRPLLEAAEKILSVEGQAQTISAYEQCSTLDSKCNKAKKATSLYDEVSVDKLASIAEQLAGVDTVVESLEKTKQTISQAQKEEIGRVLQQHRTKKELKGINKLIGWVEGRTHNIELSADFGPEINKAVRAYKDDIKEMDKLLEQQKQIRQELNSQLVGALGYDPGEFLREIRYQFPESDIQDNKMLHHLLYEQRPNTPAEQINIIMQLQKPLMEAQKQLDNQLSDSKAQLNDNLANLWGQLARHEEVVQKKANDAVDSVVKEFKGTFSPVTEGMVSMIKDQKKVAEKEEHKQTAVPSRK